MLPPIKTPTPYGGRLSWKLPGGTNVVVHLKDKLKIRHKKRWSQVRLGIKYLSWYERCLKFIFDNNFPCHTNQKNLVIRNLPARGFRLAVKSPSRLHVENIKRRSTKNLSIIKDQKRHNVATIRLPQHARQVSLKLVSKRAPEAYVKYTDSVPSASVFSVSHPVRT